METILGIVRAVLAAVAGFLVGKGYVDSETANELIGAGVVIFTAIWSVVAKSDKFPKIK